MTIDRSEASSHLGELHRVESSSTRTVSTVGLAEAFYTGQVMSSSAETSLDELETGPINSAAVRFITSLARDIRFSCSPP